MREPKLTPEQRANIAECMRLRADAEARHLERRQEPELCAKDLHAMLDRIDDAFGPADAALIDALVEAEPIKSARGKWALKKHGVSGEPAASKAEAVINWSIAARAAIKAGRTECTFN